MYKGIQAYKGTTLPEKVAIVPSQVRLKIEYLMKQRNQGTIGTASSTTYSMRF